MPSDMTIYLAGPITGKDLDEAHEFFHHRASELRKLDYTVLHPMLGKQHLLGQGEAKPKGYADPLSRDRAIFGRDQWMVAQADILFADITDAESRSLGTTFEIAWASKQPHTLVIVAGLTEGHCMDHAFIREAADHVFETVSDAIRLLIDMSPYVRGQS